MTVRSTEYFPSNDQSLLTGQTKPATTRKASATESFRLPTINHRLVSQFARLIASTGIGFIVVGLVTAALLAIQPGDWLRVVASFAAISGFIYLGLAIDAGNIRDGIIDSVTGSSWMLLHIAGTSFKGLNSQSPATVVLPYQRSRRSLSLSCVWYYLLQQICRPRDCVQ